VSPDILILRLGAMGDVLLATPLLRALRVRHPQARITFVTRTPHVPLLEHNPRLTRVVGWNPAAGVGRLIQELGGRSAIRGFSHRLDLQDNLRTRLLRLRVGGSWTSYPKHRIARAVLIRTKRNWYRDRRPVAERYFDAARALDVAPDQGSLEIFVPRSATDAADRVVARLRHQVIAIAPGASHATKRWPVHHWIALGRQLAGQGNDVVIVGGPMDRPVAEEIAGSIEPDGSAGVLENATGLDGPTTAALLRRCRALVVGDTGQMHLATAVGTPVLALFGPTVEAFGFFPYHAKARVLELDLPCRPCSASGGPVCPLKHHRCLQDLQPSMVLDALRKLPR
jgi:heptosyltransferase-2